MAKKIVKQRTLFSEDNYKFYLDFCEKSGLPYTMIESNYMLAIESDFCNVVFMRDQKRKSMFIAGAKIKKDIIKTGLVPPDIKADDLVYFNFTMPERLKNGKHTIYNIDIKSAYANILKNHSLISPKTYGYMCKLSKADRLACVGMLAAKKEIFHMVGKELQEKQIIELDTRQWFYFCVLKTGEIMQACRRKITRSFLFYWVDGLFFDNEEDAKKVGDILTGLGYKYSYDICTEFKLTESKASKKIEYFKNGEKKVLSLPNKNNSVDEFLIKFLSFHNQK